MALLNEVLAKAQEVRTVARRYDISNPRLFGSVARKEDVLDSDIDFLVDAGPQTTLFSIGGMIADLEDIFERRVDVRTLGDLHPKMRSRVLAEAIDL